MSANTPAPEQAHTLEPWFPRHPMGGREIYADTATHEPVAIFVRPEDCARAIEAVNACAGLNPSALPDVVKALEDAFDGFEDYPEAADGHVAGEFSYRDLRKIRAALASLKGAK